MNVRDWARQARIVLLTVACSLATGPSGAQQNVATAQKTLQAAFEAYNAKDYETFTTLAMQAADLNPHSVATRYYLARGYALTGETDKALEVLEYLAALGVDYGYAEHANFESLRKNAEFKSLTSDLADKLTPRINGRHRYTIDQLGIIPEGIARDPGSDRLFISCICQ